MGYVRLTMIKGCSAVDLGNMRLHCAVAEVRSPGWVGWSYVIERV